MFYYVFGDLVVFFSNYDFILHIKYTHRLLDTKRQTLHTSSSFMYMEV
ncbi:hypothetical protein HanXRQr2_Chr07g0280451 [Helianthus annuus]|uniref:Uncharacterized protein n=1 Tax=Helianthus annuus TaxID=4232 RepID=A0A9K3II28_HELAN|nr:hypothetical protein HanXRQr2_Chr07g0280451 [Helianthus annuus]